MSVRELIAILEKMNPNMQVICGRYSDFCEQEEPTEAIAYYKPGDSYPWRRSKVEGSVETEVCYFEGN